MAPLIFKLRNRFHSIEGEFSKQEILKKIRDGKLSGDEEISSPDSRWRKLASHPEFFDAFVSRLFAGKYHESKAPASSQESKPESSSPERATRQNDPKTRALDREDGEGANDPGRTHHIPADRIGNATIHQSDIDELFPDDSKGRRRSIEEPGNKKEGGTDLVPLDAIEVDQTLAREPQPTHRLDFAADSPLAPEVAVTAEKPPRKSRVRLYAGVLVVMLALLFVMGKEDAPRRNSSGAERAFNRRVLSPGETKEDRIRILVEEGDALYQMDVPQAYEAALGVYRDALGYDEGNSNALGKIAETQARLLPGSVQLEEKIRAIRAVIERGRLVDPHSSTFYRVEALIAIALEKPDEARRMMLNAAEADPSGAENYLATGEVLYAGGELSAAKISFEESVRANTASARAHSMVARVASEEKDSAKAKAAALEALKINPLHPPAYLYLADALAAQNQFKEARSLYETCGRLHRFASKEVAGLAYLRLGNLQEVAGNVTASEQSFLLAYYFLGDKDGLEAKVSKLDTSKSSLTNLANQVAYEKSYFESQGEELLRQGKLNEAIKFFQMARIAGPDDGLALIRLGDIQEKAASSFDDFRKVMNLYQRAIELDPTLAKAYVKLGSLETDQYNLDRGYKLLSQAVALAPNESEPYVALGKHFYKRQDYAEALNQFLKAAKINPTNSEISYYAGLLRLLFKKEGAKDALKFFYQAYTYDPQNYDALVEWLKLKVVSYEKNFAIKFVRNLIEEDPQNAQLYWAMGEVYGAAKESRRAINFYHKALDVDNRSSKVRMSLAKALESVGELDKAVAEFRVASMLDRKNSEGFYRAADLLYQMKRYGEAEEVLKYLVNMSPNYPGAHRYLSKIAQAKKQKDVAIAMMLREVSNNPQNAKFRLELAGLYMEYEKYDFAVQELTEVTNLPSITKAPEYVYDKIRAYLLLSRSYRALNRPESAEGAIKLAMEIDSSDPELHRELGYVFYMLQRDKEGVRAFEYYLNRSPAARDADTIKALIQQMMIEE